MHTAFAIALWLLAGPAQARPQFLVHVMPWFEKGSPEWGYHWRMNRKTEDLKREGRVASHFRPLIGAYDSADPHVIELQVLWMKVAGFDGVLANWYGLLPHWDYPAIHRRTQLLFREAEKAGIQIGVVYEDQTFRNTLRAGLLKETDVNAAIAKTGKFLGSDWLRRPLWLRFDGKPVLMVFGPQHHQEPDWKSLLSQAGNPLLLTLHESRPFGQGIFDWPVPSKGLEFNQGFAKRTIGQGIRVPVAFPRFRDWYEEGGETGFPDLPDREGETLRDTMKWALAMEPVAIQVATWNDWQEGTQVEPSVEFGKRDLITIQGFRRSTDKAFPFRERDLELPLIIYRLRGSKPASDKADKAAQALRRGRPDEARRILIE